MSESEHSGPILLAGGLVLGLAYWLLAGETSLHELLAGLIAWCGGAGLMIRAHGLAQRSLRPLRTGFLLVKIGASLAAESVGVAWILLRIVALGCSGSIGRLLHQPFRHGGAAARDASRRALVTLAKSVAPKQFVVDLADTGDLLLVHELTSEPPSPDREWPL